MCSVEKEHVFCYGKEHPYCELCFKEGRMMQIEGVYHIKPLSEDGTHGEENLISIH